MIRFPNTHQVNDFVRVSCEDGRDFIRSIVRRSLEDPFLLLDRTSTSRSKDSEARRRLRLAVQNGARPIAVTSVGETAKTRNRIAAFVMNLPDSAIRFLDAFRGILISDDTDDLRHLYDVMPMVHCYCFTRELEPSMAEFDIRNVCAPRLYLNLY
jgi:tRNA (guanine37-N1)-methyltransferase